MQSKPPSTTLPLSSSLIYLERTVQFLCYRIVYIVLARAANTNPSTCYVPSWAQKDGQDMDGSQLGGDQ